MFVYQCFKVYFEESFSKRKMTPRMTPIFSEHLWDPIYEKNED